jgi:hypothetical protein
MDNVAAMAAESPHEHPDLGLEVHVGGPAVLVGAVQVFPGLAAFIEATVPNLGEDDPRECAHNSQASDG